MAFNGMFILRSQLWQKLLKMSANNQLVCETAADSDTIASTNFKMYCQAVSIKKSISLC